MTVKKRIHIGAATLALTLVSAFIIATISSEVNGNHAIILRVKTAILFTLPLLIACIVTAGITGRSMAAGSTAAPFRRKRLRLITIASIGLLVLTPCAIILRTLAAHGEFSRLFVAFQVLELLGGLTNLTLLSLNAHEGWLLAHGKE